MPTRPLAALGAALALGACASTSRGIADARPAWLDSLPAAGEPARVFAAGVVSTNDVFASTFTPDLRTVVTSKVSPNGALRGIALVAYHWRDGRWQGPDTLPFSGPDPRRDLDPAFSPDGRRLWFSSNRPSGPAPGDTGTRVDTWYADRTAGGWGAPVRAAGDVNSAAVDMYPSVTRGGTLYFDSFRDGQRRAYVARATAGGHARSELLPPAINGDSGASNLFIDPDERYAVFIGRGATAYGAADLHVSFRRTDGSWTPARNLGPLVNTAATEFCPWVTPDGRWLFFTRVVPRPGGPAGAADRNVHVVRFDVLRDSLERLP
jgi:hypothetical protein